MKHAENDISMGNWNRRLCKVVCTTIQCVYLHTSRGKLLQICYASGVKFVEISMLLEIRYRDCINTFTPGNVNQRLVFFKRCQRHT